MSSIKLESNASGTGVFTIASPNSNTNRTLTLPDATGTIITTAGGAAISGTTGTFTGLVDISAAGAGQIQFPATQNASSNANTLDDYEEGTWSPAFAIAGGSVTNTTQSGFYTKVGNLVTAWGHLVTNGVSGSGNVTITGLPFTSASAASADGVGSKSVFLRFATDMPNLTLLVDRNATTISLFKQATNATSTASVIGTDLSNTTSYNQLNFVVSYRV